MRRAILLTLFIFAVAVGALAQTQATVIKTYTNIRSEPNSNAESLSLAAKDAKLNILSAKQVDGWYFVSFGTVKGWVIGTDIMLPAPSSYRGPVSSDATISVSPIYVNSQYNFEFTAPPDARIDKVFNDKTEFIISYTCMPSDCSVTGIFSLAEIKKFDVTVADAVRTFQQKSFQESAAKELISGFKPENNATALSKRYVAYNGRPAMRIDYNFTEGDKSLTGALIQMFIDEKKILARFIFLTVDSQSERWSKISEDVVRSLAILPRKERPNVLTLRGDPAFSNTNVPPIIPDRISGGVLNGKATSLPKPAYPAAARATRASGAVNVQVEIDINGLVTSAKAVSGHELLRQAAEKAALQAIFEPTSLSGKKVKVVGVIVYNFVP